MDVHNAPPSQLMPECMAEYRMLHQFGDVMTASKGCLGRARDLFYAGPPMGNSSLSLQVGI